MNARFEDVTGFTDGFCLDADQLPATLGRSEDATVQLTNLMVSRFHCQIVVDDDQVVVCDLNSLNGTLLNDQRIGKAALSEGDTLQVGLQCFLVRNVNELLRGHSPNCREIPEDSQLSYAQG